MKEKLLFAAFVLCSFMSYSFAQNVLTQHTVKKGETVNQIAQKYKITPHDIFQMNPASKNGIKENDVILIPAINVGKQKTEIPTSKAPEKVASSSNSAIKHGATHTVIAKETMYGIAKRYGITVEALKKLNPTLEQGLKVGQVLILPGNQTGVPATVTETRKSLPATGTHIVQPKETKFGISKKYGMTVADLERLNPGIVNSLPVGYKLTVSSSSSPAVEAPVVQKTSVPVTSEKKPVLANYEVKPGETIFSLTQSLNITEEELYRHNPSLKEGLRSGMILTVPGRGSVVKVAPQTDLSKSINKGPRKKLVLLLPFNAQRIVGDSTKTVTERLKKDAFLNMTLDFYSGALMAIDSAKTLGIPVDVSIYDSQESKASSNIAEIAKSKNLKDADAVIGPFYQQYSDKLAEMLEADKVPVISPMSKEAGKSYANLFEAMPGEEAGKRAIFDYMKSKGGNIIAVCDPKRVANKEFITTNYPEVQMAAVEDNGSLNADKLKALFVKDKINFVVIDSERTGMILSTTNVLLNETANFNIQLAIIEPNETLDFEEISMKRLTILKLLYPSMTRENHTPEALRFEEAYRRENKVLPNQYAVRGFDVTFDTLLRLAQDKPFEVSATEDATEQVESKFQYIFKDGHYVNRGYYILQYNEDLSVNRMN